MTPSHQQLPTVTKGSKTDGYTLARELGSHSAGKRIKRGYYFKLMQQQRRQQNLVKLYIDSSS